MSRESWDDELLGEAAGANQLRLWLVSFAYVLICAVRRISPAHTPFAEATCGTIRLKLLKLAGLVRVSARRITFALDSACPYPDEWRLAAARPVSGVAATPTITRSRTIALHLSSATRQ